MIEIYVAFGIASVLLVLFTRAMKKKAEVQQPPSSDSEMAQLLNTDPMNFDPMEIVESDSESSREFQVKEKWY
jgi:hypothetical protein